MLALIMGNVVFPPPIPTPQIVLNNYIKKKCLINVNRWVKEKHIQLINNLRAHKWSVF